MSQENIELLRAAIERLNRGDIPGMLQLVDPEIRFEHRMAELRGDLIGIDAVGDWFADLTSHFERWGIDCNDFRDLGDRVLGLGTVTAVGKGSGVEVVMPYTVVAKFESGLITQFTDYGDRDRALEAAGLSE